MSRLRRQRLAIGGRGRPLEPTGWALAEPGAFIPKEQVLPEGAPTRGKRLETALEFVNITALPVSGSTITLVGAGAAVPSWGGRAPTPGRVPVDCMGYIDAVFPYLEGSSGPIAGPRIIGTGVVLVWSLLLDNVPVGNGYGAFSSLISPWNNVGDDVVEMPPDSVLTATVSYTDPNGWYTGGQVGIRIKGRLVPDEKPAS